MKRLIVFLFALAGCATTPRSPVDRVVHAHPGQTIAVAYYDLGLSSARSGNST